MCHFQLHCFIGIEEFVLGNMGTGRQMLESYYIRKGMVVDNEALIATGANATRKANRKVDSF